MRIRLIHLLKGLIAVGCLAAWPCDLAAQQQDVNTPEGFACELVYEVPQGQGSWVALAVDPLGRLISSDQYGKLYRITPGGPTAAGSNGAPSIEAIDLDIGFAHGLLCAFDSLYVMAHRHEQNPAGLYRVRDTDGDDQYDSMELLIKIEGGGEHGPHAIVLSPDQQSLYICAGNHTKLPPPDTSRVPQVWQEDQVIKRLWDAGGHAVNIRAPGGWICKTDPDGNSLELVSIGYRNQFDIAFNRAGDLFTYDADMEWDIGAPWYRPTRVCHATSGSEFGWRSGTGKWPEYYHDSLPAVVDIGVGSPTGIVFGYGAGFPEKYRDALYIADWSYGVIYAVHLQPDGATYRAEYERFCAAPALPVADLVVNPYDGCLYFVVGGRRVQSGLYRISYEGQARLVRTDQPDELPAAHQLRRRLEAMHAPEAAADYDLIFQTLSQSNDRFLRFAARTALEHKPLHDWRARALEVDDPDARIEVVTAMARVGSADDLADALAALQRLDWQDLDTPQRLHLLRAYGLVRCRLDEAGTQVDAQVNQLLASHYPAAPDRETDEALHLALNRELARLLAATQPAGYVERTLQLLQQAPSQHESIHYALCLSQAERGWTLPQRRAFFQWFLDASTIRGGNSLRGFLNKIRDEAIASLSDSEQRNLGDLASGPLPTTDPYQQLQGRPLVNKWTADEVVQAIEGKLGQADLENGRKLFSIAQCYSCHRLRGDGGFVAPDLTPAFHRYTLEDLIKSIVEPNQAISDQYQATQFLLIDGRVVSGRVVNLTGGQYMVQTDMINPAKLERIKVADIEAMKPSPVSMMPSGLLDSMTAEEIRDLIGFLKSD